MQYFFLAFEIEIDSTVGNAGFARDVGDFGIEVAIIREYANGGAQDCAALISDRGPNRW
ncbi:MAG TPA: hypothetical protein VK651_02925 [Blastocatellia bacterium]|nr:hypothetical protein [Blastocatellia bacterium]